MGRPLEGWKLRAPRKPGASYTVVFTHRGRRIERSTGHTHEDGARVNAADIYAQFQRSPYESPRSLRRAVQTHAGVSSMHPIPAIACVYAVALGRFIKIGRTKNLRKRIAFLGSGSPVPVRAAAILSLNPGDEKAFHTRFAADHIRGEWFRASPELIHAIRTARFVDHFGEHSEHLDNSSRVLSIRAGT